MNIELLAAIKKKAASLQEDPHALCQELADVWPHLTEAERHLLTQTAHCIVMTLCPEYGQ